MKKFYILTLLFISLFIFCQKKYPYYSPYQESYSGGSKGFYKDFHRILVEKNIKPCENKREIFDAKILVDEKGNAILFNEVRKEDESFGNFEYLDFYKNKCTINLIKVVLKNMESSKWIPANINGKNVPAITSYIVYPDILFKDDFAEHQFGEDRSSNYPEGIPQFRNDVAKQVDISKFATKLKGKVSVEITFNVNVNGEIEDVKVAKSSGIEAFDNKFVDAIKNVQNKWMPALMYGYPVKSRYRIPFTVEYN